VLNSQNFAFTRHFGIFATECLLVDLQCAPEKWLGFSIAALGGIQRREIAKVSADVRVLGTERLLDDRDCTLIKWLGLSVPALSAKFREIIKADADVRMLRAQLLLLVAIARL
jgi:hypothetical protein